MTLALPSYSLPLATRLFTITEEWEREIPRTSDMPSCVISYGAPNAIFGDTWR